MISFYRRPRLGALLAGLMFAGQSAGKSPTTTSAALIAFLLLALGLSACSVPDAAYRFRYANSQPPQHARSVSMAFFEEELESRTNGRIEVENYFSGSLGTERQLMDLVATGVLHGTRGGFYADANPKYSLFELPFLVADWDQLLRLIYSDFTARINRGARANGFHVPACGVSQGFRNHTTSVRPLRTPDDLVGLKMRVPPQEVNVMTSRAMGANPQVIPFVEVYQAIKTGVIDGQGNALSNIWDMKFHEVQRYLSITNFSAGPDPFMVNLKWYEALPGDLQTIFDQVADEAIHYSDRMNRKSEAEYLAKLATKMEVNYVRGEELEPFRDKAGVVYEHFVEKGYFTWEEIEEAQRVARGEAR